VEDSSTRPDGYLDTLDAAFDSLDQQLSGRAPNSASARNPSGPLGQASGSSDPRSPGRSPQNGSGVPGNPVFEVDDDWFGGGESPARADARASRREIAEDLRDPDMRAPAPVPPTPIFEADDEWFGGGESQARADARAGRREISEDLRHPDLRAPAAPAAPNPIFEVDDEWFAENNKAREAQAIEQRELAVEMGIHDVELGELVPELKPAPAADLDFDFGIDDLSRDDPAPPPVPEPPVAVAAPVEPAIIEPEAAPAPIQEAAPVAPVAPVAPSVLLPLPTLRPIGARTETAASTAIADDFAALLAFEQGEHDEPPSRQLPTAPITDEMLDQIAARVPAPAPAPITDDMLERIAARVADKLKTGLLGDQLRDAMTAAVRDTVRGVISDTSERLVRDEIDRIKSKPRS
jgi:hypothetical protein